VIPIKWTVRSQWTAGRSVHPSRKTAGCGPRSGLDSNMRRPRLASGLDRTDYAERWMYGDELFATNKNGNLQLYDLHDLPFLSDHDSQLAAIFQECTLAQLRDVQFIRRHV
jgi:hypothetical protein